jgi:Ulp1 family protease
LYTAVVLISVAGGCHWADVLIFPQRRRIEYVDSMFARTQEGTEAVDRVHAFLKTQHALLGKKEPFGEWELVYTSRVAYQQRNGHDCGMFAGLNADLFGAQSSDADPSGHWLTQEHVSICRPRFLLAIEDNTPLVQSR